jgi:hypothetical protein
MLGISDNVSNSIQTRGGRHGQYRNRTTMELLRARHPPLLDAKNRKNKTMFNEKSDSDTERLLILFFRLTIGWTFLWAAVHHFGDDKFVAGFLSHTKTFHGVYAPFTSPR